MTSMTERRLRAPDAPAPDAPAPDASSSGVSSSDAPAPDAPAPDAPAPDACSLRDLGRDLGLDRLDLRAGSGPTPAGGSTAEQPFEDVQQQLVDVAVSLLGSSLRVASIVDLLPPGGQELAYEQLEELDRAVRLVRSVIVAVAQRS